MMRLAHWVERLNAETTVFQDIKDVAALAAAEDEQRRDTAFVLYVDEHADDNTLTGTVRQRCTVRVAIVLAISNRRDARGAAALDEIETARGGDGRAARLGAARRAWPGHLPARWGAVSEPRDAVVAGRVRSTGAGSGCLTHAPRRTPDERPFKPQTQPQDTPRGRTGAGARMAGQRRQLYVRDPATGRLTPNPDAPYMTPAEVPDDA